MSDYSLWNTDAEEFIRAFTAEDLSIDSVETFISGIGFGNLESTFAPMSAERLMLVYSNADYVFRPTELYWLKQADTVVSGICDNDIHVYTMEMSCDIEDYYISCAALIKLFNLIFNNNNLFIFKFPDAIAFGAGRLFEPKGPDNDNGFCVSGLISASDPDADYTILQEFAWDDYSLVIARHSPQEHIDAFGKYDGNEGFSLSQTLSSFDVGIGEERKNQLSFQYAGDGQYQRIFSYKETKQLLSSIGVGDNVSSFEVLENAEEAEYKAAIQRPLLGANTSSDDNDAGHSALEETQDADILLNEVLDQYSRL